MLKNVCQPSCIVHRNQHSGGREIQVFILNHKKAFTIVGIHLLIRTYFNENAIKKYFFCLFFVIG